MVNVLINGAQGKLGQIAVAAVNAAKDLTLVGECGRKDNLTERIHSSKANIVIDVTSAKAVYNNTKMIIDAGAHPVIGSSGLTNEQIKQLQTSCQEKQLGGIIAPNFSIGAILMMRFAEQAAKYFINAEVIELHHDKKQDAPSGTAVKTAELIGNIRTNTPVICTEHLGGALGARQNSIPIHSVRLPGLLAHQEVLFGQTGELLTIRHDTTDRRCFTSGILLACREVTNLKQLIYGLEHFV